MNHTVVKEALQKGFEKMVSESNIPLSLHARVLQTFTKRFVALEQHIKSISGEVGTQGEKGEVGEKGDQGIPGTDGRHGRDGKDGRHGKDGQHGRNGIDGKQGINAKEVDIEQLLVMLIEKVQKEKLIDISHIRNFQSFMKGKTKYGVDELMHGGSFDLVAGTNVTITTSGGKKTIAATSGGGFTTLTATETPNGVLQIFTFATATAKPSFIIADNAWMKPVSAAGTTNWTWNAGTKQATFSGTYAPSDDVEGIV